MGESYILIPIYKSLVPIKIMHEQYTFEILLISLLQSQCVCHYARVLL